MLMLLPENIEMMQISSELLLYPILGPFLYVFVLLLSAALVQKRLFSNGDKETGCA